ncbi:hypothetical protein N5J44_18005 [Acinetobacter ursingii]|nr:hypothetical protein [Acinetobacter ursingii]MDH2021021.1 hypothetical protein [Acinetobacter ursingii]MDH2073392.1 hypothetical protein [Acinetobacter ursingii]
MKKLIVYCGLNGVEMIVDRKTKSVIYLEKEFKAKNSKGKSK